MQWRDRQQLEKTTIETVHFGTKHVTYYILHATCYTLQEFEFRNDFKFSNKLQIYCCDKMKSRNNIGAQYQENTSALLLIQESFEIFHLIL